MIDFVEKINRLVEPSCKLKGGRRLAGWQVGKALSCKPETHRVTEENQLLYIVLCPTQMHCGMCMHRSLHTVNKPPGVTVLQFQRLGMLKQEDCRVKVYVGYLKQKIVWRGWRDSHVFFLKKKKKPWGNIYVCIYNFYVIYGSWQQHCF